MLTFLKKMRRIANSHRLLVTSMVLLAIIFVVNLVLFIQETNNEFVFTNRLDVPVTVATVAHMAQTDPAYKKGDATSERGSKLLNEAQALAPNSSIQLSYRGIPDGVIRVVWRPQTVARGKVTNMGTCAVGGRSWGNRVYYTIGPPSFTNIESDTKRIRKWLDAHQASIPPALDYFLK